MTVSTWPEDFDVTEEDAFAVRSALGGDPLSTDEMRDVEAHATERIDMDEPLEGALAMLRKLSEANLPMDPDAADDLVDADDDHLIISDRVRRNR